MKHEGRHVEKRPGAAGAVEELPYVPVYVFIHMDVSERAMGGESGTLGRLLGPNQGIRGGPAVLRSGNSRARGAVGVCCAVLETRGVSTHGSVSQQLVEVRTAVFVSPSQGSRSTAAMGQTS